MRILMVAAENDGLRATPEGTSKVGGIGDVMRDLPPHLAQKGVDVQTVIPSYGFLHRIPGAAPVGNLQFAFGGGRQSATLYMVPGRQDVAKVSHYVIDHSLFAAFDPARGAFALYWNDPPDRPFATDATKFALFCTAVAEALKSGLIPAPSHVHLHDWHAAFLLILLNHHQDYRHLPRPRSVYTIHNLALQGIRPFESDSSSLAAWFEEKIPMTYPVRKSLADPRWPNCVNPMAAGIRMADVVHTVSPSYAEEILAPSDAPRFYGGEGLEEDLLTAHREARLEGILNGCEYPPDYTPERLELPDLLALLQSELEHEVIPRTDPAGVEVHALTLKRIQQHLLAGKPRILLTSVTRAVEQKLYLLKACGSNGKTGLINVLEILGEEGIYVLQGTGDAAYESFFMKQSMKSDNFIFLNAYLDRAARALYASGDLFLMPSSYEPCGISQMPAMRDGQPCLVHAVGGLKDTVNTNGGANGFAFAGDTVEDQVDELAKTLKSALVLRMGAPSIWGGIVKNAAAARFTWDAAVASYIKRLYRWRE